MEARTAGSSLFVAERDGHFAGYIFLETLTDYFTLEKHGHVGMLVVAADSQGTGVGRALMETADAWALERGYAKLTLNVFETNQHARLVYDRMGYRPETVRYVKALK
jgi:GNAT superfamily N-acetyltransferase